jgi:TRAP-type uncharacterized transport system substrate-binding protein
LHYISNASQKKRYVKLIGSTIYPLVLLGIIFSVTANTQADEPVFRIGTRGNAGTYLPIGTLIAQALNDYDVPLNSNTQEGLDVLLLT